MLSSNIPETAIPVTAGPQHRHDKQPLSHLKHNEPVLFNIGIHSPLVQILHHHSPVYVQKELRMHQKL